MKLHLSMSALERAEKCQPSILLPQVQWPTNASSRGTVLHEFLARVMTEGREAALLQVPEEFRSDVEAIELEHLPACQPDSYSAEVAFAYNWLTDTARVLGSNLNRDYQGLSATEIPGTPDIVGVSEAEDAVVVGDYKTGWHDYGPAVDLWQLRMYALAAARAYGKSRAVGFLIRLKEDGSALYSRAEWGPAELALSAERVVSLVTSLHDEADSLAAGSPPRLNTGSHCLRCSAFPICPAQTALLGRLVAAPAAPAEATSTGADSPALAALLGHPRVTEASVKEALNVLPRLYKLLEWVESSVDDFARMSPVALDDGYVYGPVRAPKETLQPSAAAVVLAQRYGPDVAERAVETHPTMTKEGLRSALRGYVARTPGARITKTFEQALQTLREAGAATTAYAMVVKKHRPKRLEAEPSAESQEATAHAEVA